MTARTVFARLATATALAGLGVAPVAATAHAQAPEPWGPVEQTAFSVPAGVYCDFAFSYVPDRQSLKSRVLSRYPDGSVERIQFSGLLSGTFTNDETGATYVSNSSGVATETLNPDGSLASYDTQGPVGFGFHATDVGLPQGYYTLYGHHVVEFAPDGTRTLTVDQGTEVDVCTQLG